MSESPTKKPRLSPAEHKIDVKVGHVHETAGFEFYENVTPSLRTVAKLKSISISGRSKWQKMDIIETEAFGKTLVLDTKTQSAASDEHMYHETLVHPIMFAHPNPRTVFIGGGGEMATAREVLRHKTVEKVIMVDIDQEVVEFCLQHMPEWDDGAHKDPRLTVVYDDAKGWLDRYDGTFDVIVMDICDPIEGGPAAALYSKEFYRDIALRKLNPGGVLGTQSGPCGQLTYKECFTVINRTLASVFDNVFPYSIEIASFGCPWGFHVAYKDHPTLTTSYAAKDTTLIDSQIASRINQLDTKPFHSYDGINHRGMFGLPKYVRQAIQKETRVMTLDNPVFMY